MSNITELDKKQRYLIRATVWLIVIVLGGIQAWNNRYKPSGDITAYLDMGDAYLRGDWEQAINGYFSPLYPWILSFASFILKPSMYWEFFVVKIVNFLICLFSLVCFEFFLSEFICFYKHKLSKAPQNKYYVIPDWIWLVSGYTLFIWSSLKLIGVDKDNPDMLVAAIVYIATAIVLRVNTRSHNWLNFIMLGIVLGLGYLSKTVMFPMAFIFLATCFFSVGNTRRGFLRILVAFLVFSLISTPFIYTLSKSKKCLTFGDTGKLNYAWFISGIPPVYWQGDSPDSGIPKHPVRKIFDRPKIYEFGMHFDKTTFPLWYDSSYWYEGIKIKLNLINQIKIIPTNIIFYYQQFLGGLLFGYLIIISLNDRFWSSLKNLTDNWRLLIPAGVGLGLYMLVTNMPNAQPSMRYIAPFVVLLFAGVFSSASIPNSQEAKKIITWLTFSTLILVGVQLTDLWQHPGEPIYWKVAQELNQLGIHPGDKVAVIQIGGKNGTQDYWARLARLTIVSEIPDLSSFWQTDTNTRFEVYKAVEKTGAKAIVQKLGANTPDYLSASGWQQIGNTNYYAYFFQK